MCDCEHCEKKETRRFFDSLHKMADRREKLRQAQEKFGEKLRVLIQGFEQETGVKINEVVIGYDSKL